MKNALKLSSLLLVGMVLFQISCNKDEPAPVDNTPDPVGKWALQSATLVTPNPLVVNNFPTPGSPGMEIPAGDTQTTTALVGGALAGTVCEQQASFPSFYLELTSDGKLTFYCPDEGTVSTDNNTWVVLENPTTAGEYSLTLSVVVGGVTLPITIKNLVVASDGSQLTGTAEGYPMVQDIALPIGPDNIQFISTDMVFVDVP
jgi:hypothetical protein